MSNKDMTISGPADVPLKLTPKQVQAVAALLTNPSIEDAAKAVGLAGDTLHRWLKMPHFAAAVADAARDKIRHAATRYAAGMEIAANVLIEIAQDVGVSAAVRVQAAKALTDAADTVRRLSTLEEDVVEIKEMLSRGN